MATKYQQQGISLIEVLISLLLLAVAALGYSALQAQSIGFTDESLTRTQAVVLLRSAAEKIRINGVDNTFNKIVIEEAANPEDAPVETTTIYSILTYYDEQMDENLEESDITDCKTTACTAEQMTVNDVYELQTRAKALGVKLGMAACPGTTNTNGLVRSYCLIAAWKGTSPTMGSDSGTDCFNADGDYHPTAECIYMEAY